LASCRFALSALVLVLLSHIASRAVDPG
jgi:hypothetical protein